MGETCRCGAPVWEGVCLNTGYRYGRCPRRSPYNSTMWWDLAYRVGRCDDIGTGRTEIAQRLRDRRRAYLDAQRSQGTS